jgi:hypothetical protein
MSEDLTPPQYRCAYGACPSVTRLEDGDYTPEHSRCGIGASCPSVTAVAGDLVVVAKRADQLAKDLGKGVGPDEYAVTFSPDLLETVFTQWLEQRNA